MNVVDAIKPFTLRIKGQCGQVKASAVLLPETSVPISPVAIFQTWDGNQVFNSSAAARSGRIIGGFAGEAGSHFWPTSLDELVAVIQNGEKLGRHVRAVGSAWSFSDVAITPDYIVHMTSLNRTLGWPGIQLPNCPPIMSNALALTARGRGLYHVEAGITIRDLYTRLNNQKRADEIVGSLPESTAALAAANGDNPFNCGQVDARPQILNSLLIWNHPQWALPTMGGSGGQTLGGAISTSVHGGDFKLAPLPDMVQAVHLVGPGGKQYWIERSTPITDKQTLAKIYPEIDEQNIIYDDVWFNAILVSMGCMGIIYSLVIEVRDQYGLEEVRAKSTWSTVQPLLANGSLFASLPPWLTANRQDNNQDFVPRFLEIDVNPYPEDDNDHVCVVRSRREIGKDGLPKLPRSTQIDEGRINNIVQKRLIPLSQVGQYVV
jgi:hypothetical protein